jgi:hypothetical protein
MLPIQRLAVSTLTALSLLCGGCATTPSASAAKVADADENMVGQVQGSSGWGGLAASTGMENAKNEAREKAAQLGATHIVWQAISGNYTPYVTGHAYSCTNKP